MREDSSELPAMDINGANGVGAYEWHVRHNRIRWSDPLINIFGLTAAPLDDADFLQFVHPDDRGAVDCATSAFLAAGDRYSHQYRIIRPDGHIRHILDRGSVERDATGVAIVLRGVNIDITEVIASAQSPGVGAAKLSAVPHKFAATLGFGQYDFDIAQGHAVWSAELLRILGLESDPSHSSLEMALAIVHPDDRGRVRDQMAAAIRQIGPYDLEYRIKKPLGEIAWVRDRGEALGPIDPKTGTARHLHGVLNDITDRRTVEQDLVAANAVLEALFDEAPVGFAILDTSFRYIRVNKQLARINGLTVAQHIGKRPDEIIPGVADLHQLYAVWQEILDTGVPQKNVTVAGQTRDDAAGERVWNVHFFPVGPVGQRSGIAFLSEDVTEVTRARKALEESTQRLRRVLDGNIGFVGILEPDGTLIEANAPALQAAGIARDSVIGHKFWDAHWWSYDEEVVGKLKEAVASAAAGETVRYDAVVQLSGARRITIDFMLSPLIDDAGTVTHLIPSAFDITERERALEHVRLLMKEVNHRSKNVLALVQAIARQTVKSSPEDFMVRFSARIGALATAQDLLIAAKWDSIDLEELVRSQLAHFGDALDRRIRLTGPPATITAQAAQSLAMALHELSTNAGKYGALSGPDGRIDIGWTVQQGDLGQKTLSMRWQESGGPVVGDTSRRGFGTKLLETMVSAAFGVTATLDYPPTGLVWQFNDASRALTTDDTFQ